MIKIKTTDLSGPALDWAVAICNGYEYDAESGLLYSHKEPHFFKCYSADWSQGGPLIEREGINVVRCNDLYFPSGNEHGDYYEQYWKAEIKGYGDLTIPLYKEYGPTPLIAAMRCFVASKLGDEIEIPEELLK